MTMDVHPFFQLGETYKGTDDDGNLINTDKEGLTFDFPVDEEVANMLGLSKRTIGMRVRARVMRNESGGVLGDPGAIIRVDMTAGIEKLGRTPGLSNAAGQRFTYVVDPALGTTDVADDDLFYAIVAGPTKVLGPSGGLAITGGDRFKASAAGRVALAVPATDPNGQELGTFPKTYTTGESDGVLIEAVLHPDWEC